MSNNAAGNQPRPTIPGAVYSQQEGRFLTFDIRKMNQIFSIADKLAAAKRAADQEMNNNRPVLKPVQSQQV